MQEHCFIYSCLNLHLPLEPKAHNSDPELGAGAGDPALPSRQEQIGRVGGLDGDDLERYHVLGGCLLFAVDGVSF